MAYAVRSHSPVPEIKLDLKNGAIVECHKNSVFRTHADILVVSRNGSVESCVREKFGAQEWDKKRKKAEPTFISDWKFVKMSTSDCQFIFHFSKVYVVTVPVFPISVKRSSKKWLDEYQNMIKRLLTQAESDDKTSITIPLLGTNAGGAPKDGCVLRVMEAVFEFKKFKSLRKINLVVQGWPEVTLVQDLMAEKSGQTSDGDKYKNINQNKRKTHLIPLSTSHDTPNGRSRSPDNIKPANGNRFNSLSDQNSHSNRHGARGDNQDVRHRSNSSNSRTDGASSSNSRPSDSLTSQKTRLASARDGGGIHNVPGFHIKESSAKKDDVVAGAEGSSVDPVPYNHSAQYGNHSEYQKSERGKEDAKFNKNRDQGDAQIREGESKYPRYNSLYSDKNKDSYANVVKKNPGDSSRSNKKHEDEEFSPEYAASHRKSKVDSDNKNYSKERLHDRNSSTNYPNEELLKLNAEFDKARLQELKEIENQDNRSIPHNEMVDSSNNKEEMESKHQNGNFSSNHHVRDIGVSERRALRKVSLCSHCDYNTNIRIRLQCHHIYCDGCVPGDKGCPQCENEKFKKEDGNNSSNRGQSSNQQANAEDPEIRNIQRNKIADSSDNKEELQRKHQNGNFDSKNSQVRDMENEKMGASKERAVEDVSSHDCPNCGHYTTSRFELSCLHVFCIFCEPGDQDCPQCKVEEKSTKEENGAEASNRDQRSKERAHGKRIPSVREKTLGKDRGKYYCKSCTGYTLSKLSELPCQHFCCILCKYRNCQQCKTELLNKEKENKAEPDHRIPSVREQTLGEDRGKYYCTSCLGYTFSKLSELPCQHFCCFLCKYRNCKQCKTELLNKEKGNKAEPDNRIPSVRERTLGEGGYTTLEEKCQICDSILANNSPVQSGCGCASCAAKGCNNPTCNEGLKGNRNERQSKGTHGDDPSNRVQSSSQRTNGEGQDNIIKEKCQRCDSSLTNNSPVQLGCGHTFCASCATKDCSYPSCNKELKLKGNQDQRPSNGSHGDDPSNRVQSSSQRTYGDQDNIIKEKCQRCDSSLANNILTQLGCGHTVCARCASKGCSYQSCNKELKGNQDQRPSNDSNGDDPSNRVQSSSERPNGEGQDTMRCLAKDCNNPSCNEELQGNRDQRPSNGSSCNNKEVKNSSELYPQDARAKTALSTCYRCSVNLANNSPVQLACGHTFCASCASKGCKDQSCEEEPDYDCDDINLNESRSNKELSGNHSNRPSDTSEPNDGDTRMDNHSSRGRDGSDHNHSSRDQIGRDDNHRHGSRDRNGSVGNHRERLSSRDRNGRDGNYRDRHSSRDRMGSDGNHRDRHSSRDRNGSDGNHRDRHSSRDRNGSDGNHSNRDWNEGKGHDYREGRPKHGEDNLPPKDGEKNEMCAICMDHITDPKKLDKCGHVFCRECIDNCFKLHKPVCPSCGTMYGVTIGNMPPGTMDVYKSPTKIEGFRKYGSYCINYHFYNGVQGPEHPNPGVRFNGTTRTAYLPTSPKGSEVCRMLKVAFKRRLTFTIGRSTTTGRENVVTWNDIHHKTSMIGGPTQFGYPDPTYLTRVKEELASKGVTLADIDGVSDRNETITVQ